MTFTWSFKAKFSEEFVRYPEDQQLKIVEFTDIFEKHGLVNFNKYVGKITPSWYGLEVHHPVYKFAQQHSLWHYHIGIPKYESVHSKYLTSDWVLHFQWENRGTHIDIVDICYHYKHDGTFHLPSAEYLV